MKRIERVLGRLIGLNVESYGAQALNEVLSRRMRATGSTNFRIYADRLETDQNEIRALIEAVVVPETWFFREPASFSYLRDYVLRRLPELVQKPLRVLSVPCATGEEPYSIAMTLMKLGLTPRSFFVEAIDVSERSLSAAAVGIYGRNSFRGGHEPEQTFFESVPKGFRVRDNVRECVRFQQGNALDATLFANASFDVVFCRNLLIYLDKASRKIAIDNLRRLTAREGLLFAGHAESMEMMSAGLVRIGDPGSFAFQRGQESTGATSNDVVLKRPTTAKRRARSLRPAPAATLAQSPQREKPEDALARARECADRGELARARQICEQYLAEHEASSAAYCLLGILRNAAGDATGAQEGFDRALYLDPNNHEALIHLALLHEQRGKAATAQQLRRRAERCARKGSES